MYDEIIIQHRFIDPNWEIDSAGLFSDHWQFAKCFMTTTKKESNNTAADTDAACLLSIIINGNFFQAELDTIIDGENDIFSQAKKVRNAILHSSKLELTEDEVTEYLKTMIDVLQDRKVLMNDKAAQTAVTKITYIMNTKFVITTEIEKSAIESAQRSIKGTGESCENRLKELTLRSQEIIEDKISQSIAEISHHQDFCESHLKEQTLRSQEIIEDKTSQSIAEILRAKEDAEKNKPKDPNASGAGIAIEQEHHQDVPVQHQATPLEEVLQENALILNDIAETCAQKKIKHTDNILLLGNAGSGKSALLNTIIKALSGRYMPRARYGFGQTCALTKTLQRFENCGITEDDIADADRRDILKHAIPYLPSFFDSPPFCNSSPEMMEILELVIGGFIPPNTSFISLERLQQGNYPGFLKDKFAQSNPNWRISKIVFVQSPRDSLDERLIKMVNGLLTVEDQERCCPIYSIDNFVVITKYDLVDSGDTVKFRQTEGSSFDGLTLEHFERVEHDICSKFNIIEAKEHNMFRWVSYCDTTGYDNPYIDNIALKFIQRMLEKDSQPFKPCHIPKLAIRRWFKIKVRNLVWRCRYNWIGMGLDLMQKIFGLCIYHALVGINSISRI